MQRTEIQKILEGAPGVSLGAEGFAVEEEHQASIYLGGRNAATVVGEIVRIQLHDAWIEAEAKDRTLHWLSYEPVVGLALRRPRDPVKGRTGF